MRDMDVGNTKLIRRLRDRPARPFVAGAFVLFFVGLGVVVVLYAGATFWPGLVGNFGASLAAFMLALSWDHERERRRAQEAADALVEERDRGLRERLDQLAIEAGRRLKPIRKELGRNKKSVEDLTKSLRAAMNMDLPPMAVNSELLEGAWAANAPRLSEILSDHELVGDLAATYGRIEELRWRLRQRTALLGVNLDVAYAIARMTQPLVDELVGEIADVLGRVEEAIEEPPIRGGVVVGGIAVEVLAAAPDS